MSEIIILFHKDDLQKRVLVERDDVYDNRRTSYQDYYIHVIDMFIFNKYGEVLVQKRSKRKKNMPWLYHSSVGGHINEGDSPQLTLLKECLEEVWAPCVLVENKQEFQHVYNQIGEYTDSFVLAYAHEMMEHVVDIEADRAGRTVRIQDIIYICAFDSTIDLYRVQIDLQMDLNGLP